MVVHDVPAPVIPFVEIAGEDLYRAGVEIKVALFEMQVQPGIGFCLRIDAIRAEKHEMDADRPVG